MGAQARIGGPQQAIPGAVQGQAALFDRGRRLKRKEAENRHLVVFVSRICTSRIRSGAQDGARETGGSVAVVDVDHAHAPGAAVEHGEQGGKPPKLAP